MHKLTIDFEEWFHPFQLRSAISIPDWKLDISRIKYQTKILFEILDLTKTKATFFVVGWIADYFPEIIEQIKADGHEIGFHSYWHNPIFNLDEEAFKLDTEKAINSI